MTGRIWSNGAVVTADATAQQVREALHGDDRARAWLFLPREQSAALDQAAAALRIDALAIEDVLGEREPIKLDWIGSSMVAVLKAVAFDPEAGDLALQPVSLLAGPRAVIVLADQPLRDELATALGAADQQVLDDGVPAALHAVVDHIVDGYSDALQAMEDQADLLSEKLFQDRALAKPEQLYAFRLRRALAQAHRVTTPMRDVTSSLANAAGRAAARGEDEQGPTDAAEHLLGRRSVREFSDVADHADHAAQAADGLREVISSMYETNLALADVHLNLVMKKLTGWAAIIAVPTLITGFMGMNVPYPGFQSETGFLVAAAVMVAAVTTLFITLRRKEWI